MEKNQNTQQSSLSSSKLVRRSGRRPRLPAGWNLISLLKHHPWLIWSGLWLFLLATTTTAIFSLTNGDYVAQEPQPKPVKVESPTETSFPAGSAIPLWVLSAVALSCAAGYLVISKKLNSLSRRPAKLRKSVESSSEQTLTRRQRREQLHQELPPVTAPLEQMPPVTPPLPAEIEPVVTVLPPEESHPLDSGEESLAEMMDIRKQRSLSSILGEPFKK